MIVFTLTERFFLADQYGLNLLFFPNKYLDAFSNLNTITYKSSLTQKKMYNKTDAIFNIYGKNGINPWHFFWILT